MKVICNGNELSEALSKVIKALPVKRINPILDGVKLKAKGDVLSLYASDLELSIEKTINAEVLLEGEIVVPGKTFEEYVRQIKDEDKITLDATEKLNLNVSYLDSYVKFKCFSANEYPVYKEVSQDESFVIYKKDFKTLVEKIVYCVATDDSRPALKACCLNIKENEVEGVASDGFRLAFVRKTIQNNGQEKQILVPSKSLSEIGKLVDDGDETMTVYVESNYMMIDLFHTKVITRLVNESYINYDKIIPTDFTTEVTIDKNLLQKAINRVNVINKTEKRGVVKIEIKEDVAYFTTNTTDGDVNEKISIGLKGKDLLIGFNPKYISECLNATDDSFVTMFFKTSTSPAIIKGEDDSWQYLILPLRISA